MIMFKSRKSKIIGRALVILVAEFAQITFSIPPITGNSTGQTTPDWTKNNWKIWAWKSVEDFEQNLEVFKTVFGDPRGTVSLRKLIRADDSISESSILEIGTGSGLISLCCLQAGAKRVMATDINSNAIENVGLNANRWKRRIHLELGHVPQTNSSAFSVIDDSATCDSIISNPLWVNSTPQPIDKHALYDAHFDLIKVLFARFKNHL